MKHKKIATALASVITVLSLAFTAQPAQAAASYITVYGNTCPTPGYVCAFYDQWGGGGGVGFYNDAWDWGAIPTAYRGINNQSSSWENHGTSSYGNVRFLANPGGTGANKCLKKGYAQDISDGMGELISSNVWKNTCSGYTQFSNQLLMWP